MLQAQGESESARQSYRRAAEIDPEYRDQIERLSGIAQAVTPAQPPAYDARS
jgi:hypothetical protein